MPIASASMYGWMTMSVPTSGRGPKMYRVPYKCVGALNLCLVMLLLVLVMLASFASAQSHQKNRNRNKRLVTHTNSNSQDSSVFIQMPYSNPPTVKTPPYYESNEKCPPLNLRENWIDTLCGDLNSGYIPLNPMGHKFPDGASYPFEIIKNKTLAFFRRALPILKSDKSLPKVAKFNPYEVNGLVNTPEQYHYRMKRAAETNNSNSTSSAERLTWIMPPSNLSTATSSMSSAEKIDDEVATDTAEGRSGIGLFGLSSSKNGNRRQNYGRFCDVSNPLTPLSISYFNRFCKLYNSMWGKQPYVSHYTGPTIVPHIGPGNSLQRYDHDINYQHRIINSGPTHYHAAVPSTSYKRPPPPSPPVNTMLPQPPIKYRRHRYEALHSADAKLEMPLNVASSDSVAATAAPMPPTPCPSQVEYLTPVFARNHEGAWRYIVQIPREGYFTQTVEVTKCLETSCFYMDGDCKSSPRWQSLLVAEMYYPDTSFPTTTTTSSTTITPNPLVPSYENSNENSEYHKYQQYLKKKRYDSGDGFEYDMSYERRDKRKRKSRRDSANTSGSVNSGEIPPECDGIDHIGCFQVRLFYDWFLIPGSCKCWRRTFDFTRVHHNNRLNH